MNVGLLRVHPATGTPGAPAWILADVGRPLKFATSTVTITGTTNVHGYTASTSTVRVTTAKAGAFGGDLMQLVEKPALAFKPQGALRWRMPILSRTSETPR